MENESLFLSTPAVIHKDPNLSPGAKWILSEILNLLKVDRRWCWASNNHFCRVFGFKRTTAIGYIQELEKSGWIKTEPVSSCKLEGCQLQNNGWHRHIFPGEPLVGLVTSLVSRATFPSRPAVYPSRNHSSLKDNRKDKEKKDFEIFEDKPSTLTKEQRTEIRERALRNIGKAF